MLPNDIAYRLVQQNPDKVEIVDTPNYTPDIDFRKIDTNGPFLGF